MQADILKLKGTRFLAIHLVTPALGVSVFLAYLYFSGYSAEILIQAYVRVLAIVYPLVAAGVSSLVADQEADAGGGFFLLTSPSRAKALWSKLLIMMGGGLVACFLAVMGFAAAAPLIQADYAPNFLTCFQATLILWACSLFLYFFHMWLGLRFGRNVNFAVAVGEVLIAALMRTGLGETVWFFVPSAWGVRLVSFFMAVPSEGAMTTTWSVSADLGSLVALTGTAVMLVFLFMWIKKWEGRKNEE